MKSISMKFNLIINLQMSSPKVFSDGTWTKFVSIFPNMMFWDWNIIRVNSSSIVNLQNEPNYNNNKPVNS